MSSKKIIEDTICDNVCMLEINYINQTDFNNYVNENNTPYIIDKSGYYKLTENIETKFFPNILDSLKLSLYFVSSLAHKTVFYKRANAFLAMYLVDTPAPVISKKPIHGRVRVHITPKGIHKLVYVKIQ